MDIFACSAAEKLLSIGRESIYRSKICVYLGAQTMYVHNRHLLNNCEYDIVSLAWANTSVFCLVLSKASETEGQAFRSKVYTRRMDWMRKILNLLIYST